MKFAIYPGSFDPITNGHIDIIQRASKMFDKVYVCVADNPEKKSFFNVEEKLTMCKQALKGIKNVEVVYTNGLVVKKAKELKCCAIIRGLRAVSDFEFECKLAAANEYINKSIETIFLMSSAGKGFISSSTIKELYFSKVDIKPLVPPIVIDYFAVRKK
jgi:pantetheine-phosphate adenylyltransferase